MEGSSLSSNQSPAGPSDADLGSCHVEPAATTTTTFYSSSCRQPPSLSLFTPKSYSFSLQNFQLPRLTSQSSFNARKHHLTRHLNAQLDENSLLLQQEEEEEAAAAAEENLLRLKESPGEIGFAFSGFPGVEESVKVLKSAAKTRKVPAAEVLSALSVIKKAKLNPSKFFTTLGGTESPGRTWMLIFTAQGRLERGSYFPVTAVQRFDAAGKRIENGVYLGPIGCLTFEGRLSWKKRILAFIFECVRIKIGPFSPLQISLGQKEEREPTTKDPFFTWFYVDEEIAVAQGRGGGTAFWCRCSRVT
ncbi:hypothetical protein ACLOJK_032899 [Asimina triloba]